MGLLKVEGLKMTFGAHEVIREVSFDVDENQIVGIIGPNGSGKTTLFNLITGYYKPVAGTILFEGKQISGRRPHQINRLGIARTFQIPKPFLDMTVYENVLVSSLYSSNQKLRSELMDLLRLVKLDQKKDVRADKLNVCERKMLEIARALATEPKLLLLDEPLSGLSPKEVEEAKQMMKTIRQQFNTSILWVEHILRALRGIVDKVIVLNYGVKIAEGLFEEITGNAKVVEAYLGSQWVLG